MDILSTISLVDVAGFLLIFIVGYRFGKRDGESNNRLTPKYELGQCIIFEHGKEKKSGVILRLEIVEVHSPDFRGINQNNNTVIIPKMTRRIRYMVDTMHVKYDNDIHRNAGVVTFTPDGKKIDLGRGKVNIVWVYEDNVGCVDNVG